MLADIAYSLRLLYWAQTRDGQKNKNRPKPIEPPKRKSEGMTAEEYAEKLSRPRKGV